MKVSLGGERLGSGKKNTVNMREYERSTHDLGYVWRSTMASGTLVPFMTEVALPGDSFDIDLNADIKTHPTVGPLFGSYKVQFDVFSIPIRLYQGKLHMNMLGIGMQMDKVKLPQVLLEGRKPNFDSPIDNQQINPSCIFSYLNIRGIGGIGDAVSQNLVGRAFNAIPYLAYWDIYKNYYANKQESDGVVIHNNMRPWEGAMGEVIIQDLYTGSAISLTTTVQEQPKAWSSTTTIQMELDIYEEFGIERLNFLVDNVLTPATEIFIDWVFNPITSKLTGNGFIPTRMAGAPTKIINFQRYQIDNGIDTANNVEPKLSKFPLENIDTMKMELLRHMEDTPYALNDGADSFAPYNLPLQKRDFQGKTYFSLTANQEGLGIKTYQSDLFNNWIRTDWIDGENGVNEITKVLVREEGGEMSFQIDELNMSRKIYDMLNRIAVSGGSYDDWLDATYTHERVKAVETPMYSGGMMQELVFQEVVSNAESADAEQPLGTLAGRGVLRNDKKGGSIKIKVSEPSYIMGIVSLTPRIDYSQGNKWDVNLKTMNDFHKPALDEIGFQDLITDQMAWFDTNVQSTEPSYRSAGKQPAWINYMTNVNVVRGNFAEQAEQMFMVLNRRYDVKYSELGTSIKDLTTYIDPSKFNHIFADTRRDAQNFWVQIAVNITARRKMSAKIMPNL